MEVIFRTKEESNQEQENVFLALTPHERVMHFFELIRQIKRFKTTAKAATEKSANFIIKKKYV